MNGAHLVVELNSKGMQKIRMVGANTEEEREALLLAAALVDEWKRLDRAIKRATKRALSEDGK